jgi:hypothetical protein
MYNSNSQTTPSIALQNFQKCMKKHRSVQSVNSKQYLILYRGTNNDNELENVSSKNAVFRQGSSLTDPKSITEKDINSAIQHIANNENPRGGTRGIDSLFCSCTIDAIVAQSFGKGKKGVTILTIMIPLDDIEIIYNTKAHDATKIPLVIGSISEDEILVPHGTPIAGWRIQVTNEKSQTPKFLQTRDEINSHIKDINEEFRKSQIKESYYSRDITTKLENLSIVR